MPGLFDVIPERRQRLAARLGELARRNVWIGTSSWKYPGWLGQIYTAERLPNAASFRGRSSTKRASPSMRKHFRWSAGDFAFYQFPSPEYWAKLFLGSPATLHFAFKVPEHITVKTWPGHARYGQRAGLENENFLDAGLFEAAFTRALEPHQTRVGVLMFEFGTFSKKQFTGVSEFVSRLDAFLASLPRGWRYAVEIRNAEYLGPEYLACLRAHGVAHVYNSWTRMPELGSQLALAGTQSAEFTVTRALLRPGRGYEQAVEKFEPYQRCRNRTKARARRPRGCPPRRSEWKRRVRFVNNRLEGNAPETIEAILGLNE
jgi:uncharacterized protein YecE (DUF72 family)